MAAKPSKPQKQPNPAELQSLQQMFQQGLYAPVEARVRALLVHYPKALSLFNILALCQQQQGKLPEAVASFQRMLMIDARIPEVHFNLAVLQAQMGVHQDAINSYRKALQLKPDFTVAHFNLGTLLQSLGHLPEAAFHYQKALALEPGFFEALGNLGTVLQSQGQLEAAEQCYRKALVLRPDARGHFNLGTSLYDQGLHDDAIKAFRAAVKLEPAFADAWNDLGETLRDRGHMDEAIHCYEQAIKAQAGHDRAHYNLGEFYCLAGELQKAVPYFEKSAFADAPYRALQCLYKTRQFDVFKQNFDRITANSAHNAILMSTLSTHYATNFKVADDYQFCQQPMDYVMHTCVDELAQPNSALLTDLLHDIQHLAIAERKQGRLYYGMQSAGNLLKRMEPSIQKLAGLIATKVEHYRQHFSASSCALITQFPEQIDFTSSWYLRMKQGGYLSSHIHEEGWISGCVYLQLPDKQNRHEGSFEYSTDGDDYPRLHDDFPVQVVDQKVGDLVLFPSSLFHRTLPFHSDQERVCIAFDVKPRPGLSWLLSDA